MSRAKSTSVVAVEVEAGLRLRRETRDRVMAVVRKLAEEDGLGGNREVLRKVGVSRPLLALELTRVAFSGGRLLPLSEAMSLAGVDVPEGAELTHEEEDLVAVPIAQKVAALKILAEMAGMVGQDQPPAGTIRIILNDGQRDSVVPGVQGPEDGEADRSNGEAADAAPVVLAAPDNEDLS